MDAANKDGEKRPEQNKDEEEEKVQHEDSNEEDQTQDPLEIYHTKMSMLQSLDSIGIDFYGDH